MKAGHWVALGALGTLVFVISAKIVGVTRESTPHTVAPDHAGGLALGHHGGQPLDGPASSPDRPVSPVSSAADAQRNLHQGGVAFRNNDFDLAASYLNEALRIRPGWREALRSRYWAYFAACRWREAVGDADELLRLASNDKERYEGYCARGIANLQRRTPEPAIRDFSDALRLGGNWVVYGWRGSAYRLNLDFDRAIADFSTAIRLKGDDAGLYRDRGMTYGFKGSLDRAIADHSRAITLRPDAESYAWRGMFQTRRHDWSAALRDGKSALAIDPQYALAHELLALCYRSRGDFRRAGFHRLRYVNLSRRPRPKQPGEPADLPRRTKEKLAAIIAAGLANE